MRNTARLAAKRGRPSPPPSPAAAGEGASAPLPPRWERPAAPARAGRTGEGSAFFSGYQPSLDQLLSWARERLAAAGVDAPALNALLLLEHASGQPREALIARGEALAPPGAAVDFRLALERRRQREPLAHILGWKEFFGRRFLVNGATLIPRPETEGIVSLALDWLRPHIHHVAGPRLLDVGTGAGVIAISLLAELPGLRAVGTDLNAATLAVAQQNSVAHGVNGHLHLVACSLGEALRLRFQMVVANLPYVPIDEIESLQPEIGYEPRQALDGGPDGTSMIKQLSQQLPSLLLAGGRALFEIGEDQGPGLVHWLRRQLPGWPAGLARDAAGIERYLLLDAPL